MLVKGVFTNISGSIGGVTGSHNKGGQYLRARTTPVNPNTAAQQEARSRLTCAVDQWSNLTQAQRNAWNDFATLQTWTNRQGDPIQLSGQNHYVGMNSALQSAGLALVTVPPAPNTRPEALIIPSMLPDIGTENVGAFVGGVFGANDRYTFAVSAPLPPGISVFQGPYRIGATAAGNAEAAVMSAQVYAAIVQITPSPSVGQRFAIRARAILATGQYSAFSERITEPAVET